MISREEWIRDHAEKLAKYWVNVGKPRTDLENWFDAEEAYERGIEHNKQYHKSCELT